MTLAAEIKSNNAPGGMTYRYYFKKFWPYYLVGSLTLLGTNMLSGSIPLQIKLILDGIERGQFVLQKDWPSLLIMLGCLLAMLFIRVVSRFCLIGMGHRIELDLRQKLFRHVMQLPQAFFDTHPTGQLLSRLSNDLVAFRISMGGGIMLLLNVIFAYSVMLGLMWTLSWQLTLCAFALFPLVLMRALQTSKKLKNDMMEAQKRLSDVSSLATENLSGMSIIHSYAIEDEESRRFQALSNRYMEVNLRITRMRVIVGLVIIILTSLSIWVVLAKGGSEVIAGSLSLGSLTAFMLYLERLSWPTMSIGWIFTSFSQGRGSMERINQLLTAPVSISDSQANPAIISLSDTGIRIENLDFRYEAAPALGSEASEKEEPAAPLVLKNLTLSIPKNQFTVLVGPVGSGKSTLLNLLARRYAAPNNRIFYGPHAIETIPLDTLRRYVGYMPQNNTLFSLSLFENLTFGSPETLSQQDTERMADVTTLANDVRGFEQGYATQIGERGVMLSGGQRQRAAMTRTLLMQPDIILLDDPFASVDEPTEAAIIQALDERQLLSQRTTILATHRFEIAKKADLIIVLNTDGRIEATGRHDDLLATCALYRQMALKQEEDAHALG